MGRRRREIARAIDDLPRDSRSSGKRGGGYLCRRYTGRYRLVNFRRFTRLINACLLASTTYRIRSIGIASYIYFRLGDTLEHGLFAFHMHFRKRRSRINVRAFITHRDSRVSKPYVTYAFVFHFIFFFFFLINAEREVRLYSGHSQQRARYDRNVR